MKVLYPTDELKKVESIFLAGTIDMGKSEDWQTQVVKALEDKDVTIYNPRRKDWDSTWKQVKSDPQFYHQVNWELTCLEKADIILMYLAPGSKSPISMLELGLFAQYGSKLIVCCPDGFYRKGNIDIVCERYKITQVPSLKEGILELQKSMD